MKGIVRILAAIFLVFSFMFSIISCQFFDKGDDEGDSNIGGKEENEETVADYKVIVVDGVGNPVSNVVIKLTDGGEVNKLAVSDKSGVVVFKGMDIGSYSLTFEQIPAGMTLVDSTYEVTAEKREIRVVLCSNLPTETEAIYGSVPDNTVAYKVDAGSYKLESDADSTMYFVFQAQTKGVYKFSFVSSDPDMTIGYYGGPMFVLGFHAGSGEYDGKSFEITVQDIETPYVIGVNFVSGGVAQLIIDRTDDAAFDPQFAPWTEVEATEVFKDVKTGTLVNLDIRNANLEVVLGDDGYYYTKEGKPVYVRISSSSDYLDASIVDIIGIGEGSTAGNNFGAYIYDDNNNFVGKYSYNSMIESYYEHVDSNGVYYLTAELAEAIQRHGEYHGWWDSESPNYLFGDANIVVKNAWLFLCCTAN